MGMVLPPRLRLITALVGAIALSCSPAGSGGERSNGTSAAVSPTSSATGVTPAVSEVRGLVYATIDAGGTPLELELDLYLPEGPDARPLLVYIHGGGWFEGTRAGCPGRALAAGSYAVACIDYRLVQPEGCPTWSIFPGAALDVRAAVDWLRAHADDHGLDPTRVALIGDSSGGHLATLVGMSAGVPEFDSADGPPGWAPVQAVVDWYGPADIRDGPVAFTDDPCTTPRDVLDARYGGGGTPYFPWTLAWGLFLGGGLTDPIVAGRAPSAAPATHADASDPPVLVVHGEADDIVPIRQSELLVERLTAAGVTVTFIRVPGRGHSFGLPDAPAGAISPEFLDPTWRFLAEAFGRSGG
jgi:acetyl esterase/lipase